MKPIDPQVAQTPASVWRRLRAYNAGSTCGSGLVAANDVRDDTR